MSVIENYRYARLTDLTGRVPYRSARELQQIQAERLQKLLSHARQHSKYYRRQFAALPADAPLSQYPITTKEQVRDNLDDVLTDPRLKKSQLEDFVSNESNLGKWYLGDYAVSHTSGSQGSPLLIVQDRHCMRVVLATMSSRCRPGKPPGLAEGIRKLIQPPRLAVISFRRGFYPSGITLEFMQGYLGRLARVYRFSSVQPDLIEQLHQLQPQVISAYASVLEALSLKSHILDLKSIQYFTNSSEQLSARARNRVESAFKVPVFDHYGTGECLQLADGCSLCGDLHVNSDWAILEVVDDQGRPVPNGEPGSRVLLTNLANHVQPFIRYEVPDRVTLRHEGTSCPKCLPRIQAIEGRSAEIFWVQDGRRERFLTGVLFHHSADSLHIIREWRAIQKLPTQIVMQVQLLAGHSMSAAELQGDLSTQLYRDGLPASVEIQVEVVREIQPDVHTGKMRRMISEIQSPPAVSVADH